MTEGDIKKQDTKNRKQTPQVLSCYVEKNREGSDLGGYTAEVERLG